MTDPLESLLRAPPAPAPDGFAEQVLAAVARMPPRASAPAGQPWQRWWRTALLGAACAGGVVQLLATVLAVWTTTNSY